MNILIRHILIVIIYAIFIISIGCSNSTDSDLEKESHE